MMQNPTRVSSSMCHSSIRTFDVVKTSDVRLCEMDGKKIKGLLSGTNPIKLSYIP